MGGALSFSIANRYRHKIWVKYDVEKKYVQMEKYEVKGQAGFAGIGLGAGVSTNKKYDWNKIETKFTPVNPCDFKELSIDCKGAKVVFVTIIAENDEIICHSLPIDYKHLVVTKHAQLREAHKKQPMKVHKKYDAIDMGMSRETVSLIQEARVNQAGKPNENSFQKVDSKSKSQDSLDGLEEEEEEEEEEDEALDTSSLQLYDKDTEVYEATALYDFTGRTEQELSFKKGDNLLLYTKAFPDWWEGAFAGKEGLVPANFVVQKHPQDSLDGLEEEEEEEEEADTSSIQIDDEDTEVYEATALYDFKGRTDRELSFKKGDNLLLYTKAFPGWWEGAFAGKEGLVPANYVVQKHPVSSSDITRTF